jgi:hypothetical protein
LRKTLERSSAGRLEIRHLLREMTQRGIAVPGGRDAAGSATLALPSCRRSRAWPFSVGLIATRLLRRNTASTESGITRIATWRSG